MRDFLFELEGIEDQLLEKRPDDRTQNEDARQNNHQFNQRKTFLHRCFLFMKVGKVNYNKFPKNVNC
jgi:hypothetical protein